MRFRRSISQRRLPVAVRHFSYEHVGSRQRSASPALRAFVVVVSLVVALLAGLLIGRL